MSKGRKSQIGEIVEMVRQAAKAGLKTADALDTIYADMGSPGIKELKKIMIIGSSGLYPEMKEHQMQMVEQGHSVRMPTLDKDTVSVEHLVTSNKKGIQEADEIHLFWDGRSIGTILDLGMVIAYGKPLKIMKLEKKSIPEYVEKYAAGFDGKRIIENPTWICGKCGGEIKRAKGKWACGPVSYCLCCRLMYRINGEILIPTDPEQYMDPESDDDEESN